MPASTRSSTRQPKLEDLKGVEITSTAIPGRGTKRGATSKDDPRSPKKRRPDLKSEHSSTPKAVNRSVEPKESREEPDQGAASSSQSIAINRAPVLELWSATVTQFLYPSLSWDICLSAGGAISSMTAISKGRSVGMIAKPDPGQAQEKSEKRKRLAEKENLDEIEVMRFHLQLKDGRAMIGEKGKKGNEVALKKKFGNAEYQLVKTAFQEGLERWRSKEDELSEQAFHFYEEFRPNVPHGQKGWGKKGRLNLEAVRSAIFPP